MATNLYYRTDHAEAILTDGFRNSDCDFIRVLRAQGADIEGVFLCNVPLGVNEGARGKQLLKVTIDQSIDDLADYEVIEAGSPYRWWIIPAEVLAKIATVDRDEEGELS